MVFLAKRPQSRCHSARASKSRLQLRRRLKLLQTDKGRAGRLVRVLRGLESARAAWGAPCTRAFAAQSSYYEQDIHTGLITSSCCNAT